jgi:hypothetical protein
MSIQYVSSAQQSTTHYITTAHHPSFCFGSRTAVFVLPIEELARGQPTAQSSTGWDGVSSRAVDGNSDVSASPALHQRVAPASRSAYSLLQRETLRAYVMLLSFDCLWFHMIAAVSPLELVHQHSR